MQSGTHERPKPSVRDDQASHRPFRCVLLHEPRTIEPEETRIAAGPHLTVGADDHGPQRRGVRDRPADLLEERLVGERPPRTMRTDRQWTRLGDRDDDNGSEAEDP